MSAACRSCSAPIVWARTETGKRTPVDAEPVEHGTILLRHEQVGEPPTAHVTSATERDELERRARARGDVCRLFVSHFATCPHAAQHRRA